MLSLNSQIATAGRTAPLCLLSLHSGRRTKLRTDTRDGHDSSDVATAVTANSRGREVWTCLCVLCAGFSDAWTTDPSTCMAAGVREAPRHEIAEYGAGSLSAAYGDLAATLWLCGAAVSRHRSRNGATGGCFERRHARRTGFVWCERPQCFASFSSSRQTGPWRQKPRVNSALPERLCAIMRYRAL